MLHKSYISNIEIYTDEWHLHRLGKFTSSRIIALMADKPMSSGALTYIDQKAAEFVTQQTTEDPTDEVEDENTVWGVVNEPLALQQFANIKKVEFLVTQKMVYVPGTQFSSTPDGIWVIDSSITKEDCYNVATVEVKCPRTYPRFLSLYRCNTALDLKKQDKKHFCQVIDQMDNCDSALGYYVVHHPLFPKGKNTKIIEFRKIDLWDEFRLLKERKAMALARFYEVVSEFMS